MLLRYGTTGALANPWDEACRLYDGGLLSKVELIFTARELFSGEALDDVLTDLNNEQPQPVSPRG